MKRNILLYFLLPVWAKSLRVDNINITCVRTFLSCILPDETNPTMCPTIYPTTANPTTNPTTNPTPSPTIEPFFFLIKSPTFKPSLRPSLYPTVRPSLYPTVRPTFKLSFRPTYDASVACRNAWQNPFLSTSIWNTPIGSNAVFYPAGIFTTRKKPDMIFSDTAYFIKTSATDPPTLWYRQVSWSKTIPAMAHCNVTTAVPPTILPFPSDFIQTVYGNNVGSVLSPDGETVVQMLQLYRCTAKGPVFGSVKGNVNIFKSNGTYGAHGGSGLSGIGGAIRPGELLPNNPDIAHNLNLQIYAAYYYYKQVDSNGVLIPGSCRTWPAIYCDGEAYAYGGTNPYLRMGALLAVPLQTSKTIRVQTIPGQRILHALTYYGGYIKDSQGVNWATIALDNDAQIEFKSYYGYDFLVPANTGDKAALQFYNDMVKIFQALSVVTNNGPNSVGGGGKPLAPAQLPIC